MLKDLTIVPIQSHEGGNYRFSPVAEFPPRNLVSGEPGGEGFLALVLCLEGALRGACPVCGHSFRAVAGQSLLVSSPAAWPHLESDAATPLRGLLILFDRESLRGCCAAPEAAADGRFQPFFDAEGSHRVQVVPLSVAMGMTVRQVLECPFASPVREIFLQSKALELLARCLGALEREAMPAGRCRCRLGAVEKERILQAREILVRDMENPPGIEELALRVGLSATKLKRGFRQLFGTSVFDYFRNHRLEAARRILERSEMNVTGAALAVGYSNIGHFCAAFKRQFGFNPGHCLRHGAAPAGSDTIR
ncbi:MAG: helix-turn-helix transcriptional regulator [Deltaproteobacteria bacterium]|nr:helix-turn-helix transcriptional regulator [Deltaproteobacteria bacterium]